MKNIQVILAWLLCTVPAPLCLAQARVAPPPAPAPPAAPMEDEEHREIEIKELHELLPQQFAGVRRALIVPKDKPGEKFVAEMEEDLNVMARILAKATGSEENNKRSAMGIFVPGTLFGATSAPQNLYLDGYGTLFMLTVNYPLLAPATKTTETEDKEQTSTEWEDAKRELYQARGSGGGVNINIPGILSMASPPAERYDADKVEELKTDLINSLKNAAHIRGLKSEEMVTLVVSGRKGGGGETRAFTRRYGNRSSATALATARADGISAEDRMVIRARKLDVDDFQKGKLNAEEFRKKVSVALY